MLRFRCPSPLSVVEPQQDLGLLSIGEATETYRPKPMVLILYLMLYIRCILFILPDFSEPALLAPDVLKSIPANLDE